MCISYMSSHTHHRQLQSECLCHRTVMLAPVGQYHVGIQLDSEHKWWLTMRMAVQLSVNQTRFAKSHAKC